MRILLAAVVLFSLTFAASADITFELTVDEQRARESGGTIPARAVITNRGPATAAITLELHSISVAQIAEGDPKWECTGSATDLQCSHAPLAPGEQAVLDFLLRLPERAGRARVYGVARSGSQSIYREISATLWRRFHVTNGRDSGEGTLRAAILAVNAERLCALYPCRIEFDHDMTVLLTSPLPAIVANDVEIDGTPHEVGLYGIAFSSGNGLHIRGDRMAVRGLTLEAFPENAIFYEPVRPRGNMFTIEKNRILFNGGRGIVIQGGVVTRSHIRGNAISANSRSGIFIVTDADPALPIEPTITIAGNDISRNRASGIFFGPAAQSMSVFDNVISHNGHFGIAVSRGATLIRLGVNRIFANAGSGIDYGLDGPSGVYEPPLHRGLVATLESARYEAATGTTIITGRGPADEGFRKFSYAFYVNDSVDAAGYAEGEVFLGSVTALPDGRFTLLVPGNLRGRYITAVATVITESTFYESFEFSKALRVE